MISERTKRFYHTITPPYQFPILYVYYNYKYTNSSISPLSPQYLFSIIPPPHVTIIYSIFIMNPQNLVYSPAARVLSTGIKISEVLHSLFISILNKNKKTVCTSKIYAYNDGALTIVKLYISTLLVLLTTYTLQSIPLCNNYVTQSKHTLRVLYPSFCFYSKCYFEYFTLFIFKLLLSLLCYLVYYQIQWRLITLFVLNIYF